MNWTTLAASVSATIAGGMVWWLRKGALTQIVFLGGILMNVIVAINFLGPDTTVPLWVFGAVTAAIGIAWVALGAAERIIPVRTALRAGVATLLGLQMMVRTNAGFQVWAALLAVGVGIAAIAASIYLKRAILLGFGAVTIILFSLMTALQAFGGTARAPILLLVMGVVFIAVAVVAAKVVPRSVARRRSRMSRIGLRSRRGGDPTVVAPPLQRTGPPVDEMGAGDHELPAPPAVLLFVLALCGCGGMADAHGSGPCGGNPVKVQLLSPAPSAIRRLHPLKG